MISAIICQPSNFILKTILYLSRDCENFSTCLSPCLSKLCFKVQVSFYNLPCIADVMIVFRYKISLGLCIWRNPILGLGWAQIGLIFLASLYLCSTSAKLRLRFWLLSELWLDKELTLVENRENDDRVERMGFIGITMPLALLCFGFGYGCASEEFNPLMDNLNSQTNFEKEMCSNSFLIWCFPIGLVIEYIICLCKHSVCMHSII